METLLIGDNPFIGVSHLSKAQARDKVRRLDIDRIITVIERALACGATGYTFSIPHPTNLEIMNAWKRRRTKGRPFELHPILPYAEGLVRAANEKGMSGLATELMSRLSFGAKSKLMLESGISAMTADPLRMLKTYVDVELSTYLNAKPENASLATVFLHEVIVDFSLSFGLVDLPRAFIKHIRDNYHATPGFVTRNFAKFVERYQDKIPLRDVVIMTPFNKVGFQMNPSKESSEKCLDMMSEGRIFAMSLLAAGYLKLDDAVEYLKSLPRLSGVAVGVSTPEHAENTFTMLKAMS